MIDENGKLTISLYHGTSSIFLDSISMFGLGGKRDPNIFDLEILEKLAKQLGKPENRTEWWDGNSFIAKSMVSQRVSNSFNFRYGGVYLTPSRLTARNYARSNKLGSELLSTIQAAFDALTSVNPNEAQEIIPEQHVLRELFKKESTPILIEAKGLDASKLSTETGNDIRNQLDRMEQIRSRMKINTDTIWQQFNFELQSSINAEQLIFHSLSNDQSTL